MRWLRSNEDRMPGQSDPRLCFLGGSELLGVAHVSQFVFGFFVRYLLLATEDVSLAPCRFAGSATHVTHFLLSSRFLLQRGPAVLTHAPNRIAGESLLAGEYTFVF
jgi:hypothetical protein